MSDRRETDVDAFLDVCAEVLLDARQNGRSLADAQDVRDNPETTT